MNDRVILGEKEQPEVWPYLAYYTSRIHHLANVAGDLKMGENCRIDAFVTITGDVTLGDNVHIGTGACLFGAHRIIIGNGVSISPGAKLFTATEDMKAEFPSNPQLPQRCVQSGTISVYEYAVVGANAVVLPNVHIGKRAQVGALSLVNKSVQDDSIVAGIPIKTIGSRRLAA